MEPVELSRAGVSGLWRRTERLLDADDWKLGNREIPKWEIQRSISELGSNECTKPTENRTQKLGGKKVEKCRTQQATKFENVEIKKFENWKIKK